MASRIAVALCIVATGAEFALAWAVGLLAPTVQSVPGALIFLVPLAALGCLSWWPRRHPALSRAILAIVAVVVVFGVAAPLIDYAYPPAMPGGPPSRQHLAFLVPIVGGIGSMLAGILVMLAGLDRSGRPARDGRGQVRRRGRP